MSALFGGEENKGKERKKERENKESIKAMAMGEKKNRQRLKKARRDSLFLRMVK